jgi:hypothetical protein
MRLARFLACAILAIGLGAAQVSAQGVGADRGRAAQPGTGAQQPGTRIEVTDSPGSVNAGTLNVRTMIIYQAARVDPATRQFVTTLRRFVQTMVDQTAPPPGGHSVYFFALDGGTRGPSDAGTIYNIVAGIGASGLYGPNAASCEVANGVTVAGYLMRRSADMSETRIETQILTREHMPLLQRICQGLRMPVASLAEGGGRGSEPRGPSVFDYLRRNSNGVGITLIPADTAFGSLEESWFQHYWVEPLFLRYRRGPNSISPGVFSQLPRLERGEGVTGSYPGLAMAPGASLYLPDARREFGERLNRLDTDWTNYLRTTIVTLRSQSHPVLVNGRVGRILPRFRPDEVGSVEFWRSADDVLTALHQAHCVAQQFLVDREYVAPEDAPYIQGCALSDIRQASS